MNNLSFLFFNNLLMLILYQTYYFWMGHIETRLSYISISVKINAIIDRVVDTFKNMKLDYKIPDQITPPQRLINKPQGSFYV